MELSGENAPRHPRIYRYLAMSRTLAERMIAESNIRPSDLDVFLNGLCLQRFPTIRQLPEKPLRAAFYSRVYDAESATVRAARAATEASGMSLDLIGQRFENYIYDPEVVLPTYDVVFASGRSAIEALACGCAVVVLGRSSCGEMVTPENFDRFREVNFSIAVNSAPPNTAEIFRQLSLYSPSRSAEVTRRLRAEADSRLAIHRLIEIYEQVIARHQAQEIDPREESLADIALPATACSTHQTNGRRPHEPSRRQGARHPRSADAARQCPRAACKTSLGAFFSFWVTDIPWRLRWKSQEFCHEHV